MAWTEQQTKIHAALNQLMKACDLSGESGTERMFGILSDAIDNVDWSIVEQSHRDGLCYDVNCLLTDAIIDAQRPHEPDAAAPETEPETVTEPSSAYLRRSTRSKRYSDWSVNFQGKIASVIVLDASPMPFSMRRKWAMMTMSPTRCINVCTPHAH